MKANSLFWKIFFPLWVRWTPSPSPTLTPTHSYFEKPRAQRVQRWPTDLEVLGSSLARGEIFSTVNGVPLHKTFDYHPSIMLLWLKNCWKGREKRKSSIHPSISHFDNRAEKQTEYGRVVVLPDCAVIHFKELCWLWTMIKLWYPISLSDANRTRLCGPCIAAIAGD